MRSRVTLVRFSVILVALISVIGSGCGKESTSPTVSDTPTDASNPEAQRSQIESCLADAGLEVETENVPRVAGEAAIGVRSSAGGGRILPGDLEAAIYVYDSEAEAKQANDNALGSPEVRLGGNVVIQFAPKPSDEFSLRVRTCAFADEAS